MSKTITAQSIPALVRSREAEDALQEYQLGIASIQRSYEIATDTAASSAKTREDMNTKWAEADAVRVRSIYANREALLLRLLEIELPTPKPSTGPEAQKQAARDAWIADHS